MKKSISFLFIIILTLFYSCNDNSVDPYSTDDLDEHDYEFIEEEFDGLLQAGEVFVDSTYLTDGSKRAIFYNRGIDIWKNIKVTKYVHKADHVIDSANGIYKYDCSGFGAFIMLKPILEEHYNDLLANDTTGGRPLAGDYYDYFRSIIPENQMVGQNNFWKAFMSADELKPCDFVIVRYDNDWRKKKKERDGLTRPFSTGHVMIAWQIGAMNEETNSLDLRVYDCSSSGHSSDTRKLNTRPIAEKIDSDHPHSGIGFGWMTYKISTNGHRRPYAYKWSLNTNENHFQWYNLVSGDNIDEDFNHNRLEGIIFARPI
jgi:hypothetical protein